MNPPYSERTYQAVLTLLSQGQAPSWRKVREITGTGSSTDLVREIKTIMRELAQRSAAGEYPKEVQDAFFALWNGAKAVASTEFDAERNDMEAKVLEAQAAQTAAEQATEEADENLARANAEIVQLREQCLDHKAREATLTQQLQQANDRIDAGTGREAALNEQIAALNQRILELQNEHDERTQTLRKEHEAFLADMAVENQKAINRLKDEIKAADSRYEKDTARIMRSWDQERVRLLEQLRESQKETKASRDDVVALRGKLAESQADNRVTQEANTQLTRQNEELRAMLKSAEARATEADERTAQLVVRLTEQANAAQQQGKGPAPLP